MFLTTQPVIDELDDSEVGKGLKAAMRLFATGEITADLSGEARAVFLIMKPAIDEAFAEYNSYVESGKAGATKRWGKKKSKNATKENDNSDEDLPFG